MVYLIAYEDEEIGELLPLKGTKVFENLTSAKRSLSQIQKKEQKKLMVAEIEIINAYTAEELEEK